MDRASDVPAYDQSQAWSSISSFTSSWKSLPWVSTSADSKTDLDASLQLLISHSKHSLPWSETEWAETLPQFGFSQTCTLLFAFCHSWNQGTAVRPVLSPIFSTLLAMPWATWKLPSEICPYLGHGCHPAGQGRKWWGVELRIGQFWSSLPLPVPLL